jgi:integrase
MVAGVPTLFETGHYEVRTREGWKNVGENASEAESKRDAIEKRGTAQEAAHEAGTEIVEVGARVNLKDAAKAFTTRQRAVGHKAAASIFERVFNEFIGFAKIKFADEITPDVVLRWYVYLQDDLGNTARTVDNKHVSLFSLLNYLELDTKKLNKAAPTPKYTEADVETFSQDELSRFFAVVDDPYYRLVFTVLLKTGLRKEEAATLEWSDLNLSQRTLTLTAKPDIDFLIKDKAGRTVPIPELVDGLKAWHESHPGTRFVLGTSEDKPHTGWPEMLKRYAAKAELNCGHCKGCKDRGMCEHWHLHKFRATYTTKMLQTLGDPRTVMVFTGHADLKTIMRYLKPADAASVQDKVSAITWGD